MSTLMPRRDFLAGVAALGFLAGCESHPRRAFFKVMGAWNGYFEAGLFSPMRLSPELPVSEQTPEEHFPYFYRSSSVPLAPPNWHLKIGGLVKHPLTLRLEQLMAMPSTEMRVRHYCVNGWTAVASWRGVRVSEIARMVGIDPRTKYVEFRSFDSDYWSGWDLGSALHPQTMLAYAMNGHPLGVNHGAPLRLYSAIKLGYKSVKYLTEVNFLPNKVIGTAEVDNYDWFGGL
jgi:DMSO/TMAO reductase YedYZ molybdopterin-dependent catalytic subunit